VNRVLQTGAAGLGCLLAAAVIVVAIPAPHAAQPVTVSYAADQATLARLAPYPAVAPAGLPGSRFGGHAPGSFGPLQTLVTRSFLT